MYGGIAPRVAGPTLARYSTGAGFPGTRLRPLGCRADAVHGDQEREEGLLGRVVEPVERDRLLGADHAVADPADVDDRAVALDGEGSRHYLHL